LVRCPSAGSECLSRLDLDGLCPNHHSHRCGWTVSLFCNAWREAFLISWSYGMGDPMAPSECAGNSEGGGSARRIASHQAKRAGITRP
jgi:hypothetical protein